MSEQAEEEHEEAKVSRHYTNNNITTIYVTKNITLLLVIYIRNAEIPTVSRNKNTNIKLAEGEDLPYEIFVTTTLVAVDSHTEFQRRLGRCINTTTTVIT